MIYSKSYIYDSTLETNELGQGYVGHVLLVVQHALLPLDAPQEVHDPLRLLHGMEDEVLVPDAQAHLVTHPVALLLHQLHAVAPLRQHVPVTSQLKYFVCNFLMYHEFFNAQDLKTMLVIILPMIAFTR